MARKILHEGRFLRFVDDDSWEFVERRGCTGIVVIIAVTDDDRLILVEQWRPAVGKQVIELPAGLVGDKAQEGAEPETEEDGARRELLEETGYLADTIAPLVSAVASPGLSNESVTFYRASGLQKIGPGGGAADENEDIKVHEIPLTSVEPWLQQQEASGCMIAVKVYAGLFFLGQSSG